MEKKHMEFITEFIKRARTETGSFEISSGSSTYHFIKDQVGTATYIYGIRNYKDPYDCARISNKPELVAILKENTVYIVDMFRLGMSYKDSDSLPENVVLFSEARKEKFNYMYDILLPFYYESTETKEISDNEQTRTGAYAKPYCRRIAREGIFDGENTETYIKNLIQKTLGFTLSEDEYARTLCGFTTLEDLAKKQFEKSKDRWTEEKALIEKIRTYMERTDTVEDWELAIAEGIRNIDAKNLTIEFKKDMFSFTGKIDPHRLLNRLQEEKTFHSYDFNGSWAETAGVDRGFRCENIVKIKYGKKVLFETK